MTRTATPLFFLLLAAAALFMLFPALSSPTAHQAAENAADSVAQLGESLAVDAQEIGYAEGDLYSLSADDYTLTYGAATAGTLDLGKLRELPRPTDEVLDSLEKAVHANSRHVTTSCVVSMARTLAPHEAYFSLGSSKNPLPSIAFVWKGGRFMREMGLTGACANLLGDLRNEFGKNVDPVDVRFAIVVGIRPNGTFFPFTAYAIRNEFFALWLSDWNYLRIW